MKEFLRRFLRSLVVFALRLHSQSHPIPTGGRCLVIAPHQDDEALGCAGLIDAYRTRKIPVDVIYLTDGAGSHIGHPRLSPQDIAQLRRAEAIKAMQLLEVDIASLHFLDAPDGRLSHLSPIESEIFHQRLAGLLVQIRPAELFLPCRDDSSSEHTAAFQLTQRALAFASLSPRLFEYPVWARWRPQQLWRTANKSRRIWHLKFRARPNLKRSVLNCYATQTAATPPWNHSVLPPGFIDCFDSPVEFFFER